MKKFIALLLCVLMVLPVFAGCNKAPAETPAEVTAPAEDVAMQYISVADALAVLEDDSYIFFDVRKAADHQTSHIPGAEGHDMDAAKEGDFAAGVATMKTATQDLDKNIVIICYSGKRYAQATTNVLAALGYDMTKVYTLEGGYTAWTETYPDKVEVSTEIVAPAEDVAMQYITPADALAVLNDEGYVFFDVRKAADYETAHIPGAKGFDMDAAKEGDFNAGVATMQVATRDLDKNIIVICYSGKRYAQATTNVLSALGYDMSKVYTLEGGFTAWSETYPDTIEPAPVGEIDPQIHFAGSSTLAPVIASIGAAYQAEYGTWDKVNPAFPAEEIDIAVTSGGSGDGPKSVIDGTADFGMLARAVKDSEKESLGAGYTEFMVASDALTISVNKNNPICALIEDLDTDTIRKIFSGEIGYWDELDASLEHKEIVVVIRDLSGGAAEVFEKNVMQGTPISENAIQTPSMGALAAKIMENVYAIGYAGYGVYNQNQDGLYAFKVDGVEPSEENILNGSYKIQRPVLFVINRELDAAEKAFVDYIFSDTGRSIVIENGYIPAY